jgi:predicted AAA+ superfamily ATPase
MPNDLSTLATLREEFFSKLRETEHFVPRNVTWPETALIKVVIGMRRVGKTALLFQHARSLLAQGLHPERVLYLNFEDDRLLPMSQREMGQLIESWYSLFPTNHDHRCVLLLDEVQNVEGWDTVVRRFADSKNVDLVLTGSSAKLLSSEIATSLRGRSITLELQPFDYPEYLQQHALPAPEPVMGQRALDFQKHYMREFLKIGGFPGVQQLAPIDRIEVLQGYVETVIFRDIVERHQITNLPVLKYLTKCLLKGVGSPFSMHKFYQDVGSQGLKVGKDTLHAYLGHLEDAFLLFCVPIWTESLRQLATTPKKIYAIDTGLLQANTFNFSDNLGRLFENRVYLDLRRQRKEVFYAKTSSGFEIDFVTRDPAGVCECIQVVWDQQDAATRHREERALQEAEQEFGIPGRILDLSSYLSSQGGANNLRQT